MGGSQSLSWTVGVPTPGGAFGEVRRMALGDTILHGPRGGGDSGFAHPQEAEVGLVLARKAQKEKPELRGCPWGARCPPEGWLAHPGDGRGRGNMGAQVGSPLPKGQWGGGGRGRPDQTLMHPPTQARGPREQGWPPGGSAPPPSRLLFLLLVLANGRPPLCPRPAFPHRSQDPVRQVWLWGTQLCSSSHLRPPALPCPAP